MIEWINMVVELGVRSLSAFWIPVAVWTLSASVLYVCLTVWRRSHAQVRYLTSVALLLALPVGFLLMPITTGLVGGLPTFPRFNDQLTNGTHYAATVQNLSTTTLAAQIASASENSVVDPKETVPLLPFTLGLVTIIVMAIGAIGLWSLFSGIASLKQFRKVLRPITRTREVQMFERLSSRIGLRRVPVLAYSSSNVAPMTFGWRAPVVILPMSMVNRSSEYDVLQISILHELMHIKRHDFFMGSLVRLVAAPFTWHPLVRILTRQIELQRELACDSDVIAHENIGSPRYAKTLVTVSQMISFAPSLSIKTSKKVLTQRIRAMEHLLTKPSSRPSRLVMLAIVGLFVLLPSLLTACTSSERTPETTGDYLVRLETELEYLEMEIAQVAQTIDRIAQDSSYSPNESWELQTLPKQRRALLHDMYIAKLQAREEVRMAVNVQEMLAEN